MSFTRLDVSLCGIFYQSMGYGLTASSPSILSSV